ncbi:hypothetical protein GLE_3853 [Lysobacter enzymogenes]|uniref:Uncharacterized protein n=1 Tax=Lysobacter enzymogenes TaxID=69 RepID=A0A0S2DKW8_LYSEN|nr:hypothetical protein GLE_3853 [Lysobacter enzymogenes]
MPRRGVSTRGGLAATSLFAHPASTLFVYGLVAARSAITRYVCN